MNQRTLLNIIIKKQKYPFPSKQYPEILNEFHSRYMGDTSNF